MEVNAFWLLSRWLVWHQQAKTFSIIRAGDHVASSYQGLWEPGNKSGEQKQSWALYRVRGM